ncbi:unnamed protein product [Schistocephalus solidus]|nr:unnamed protein product [Schistocephalus solidus]
MTAIDPDSGQLVEVPIDPNNTYVVQDSSALLAGGQVQIGGVVQAGKSLLKPELAQHLIQPVGYKTSLARGGFTQSIVDPRMTQSVQRGSRVLPGRKSVGSSGMQVIGMAGTSGLIQQSAALAPTASGLLSLGTRYTPSCGSTLGVGPTGNTGSLIATSGGLANSAGVVPTVQGGGGIFTTGTVMTDRDASYRLAAAMSGASSRGRPRGRRPLRGQFPVVPIDMVRQLGIEQQVILQPAAPVAARNKAILCRPLSVSRKTQSTVHARDAESQTEPIEIEEAGSDFLSKSSKVKYNDPEEEVVMEHDLDSVVKDIVEEEEDEEATKKDVETIETDSNLSGSSNKDSDDELDIPDMPRANTTQTEDVSTSVCATQTDEPAKVDESDDGEAAIPSESNKRIEFIPIPVPVPIYIPVPVYLYARPVPYAVPFPLPCVIPLPLLMNGHECDARPKEEDEKEKVQPPQHQKDTKPSDEQRHLTALVQKRPAPRDSLTPSYTTATTTATAQPAQQPNPSKRQRTQAEESSAIGIPPSRRIPSTTSDASYHLKFSYGINAWRHWVNHSMTGGRQQRSLCTELLDVPDDELNLALSRFVHEVRKPNNETYVADSIFYLCLGIQEYLNENGRSVNLFGKPKFAAFADALDTVLADFQPRISPEGLLICRIEEEHLWEARQLGAESPQILIFTLLYYITKHYCLRTGENHSHLTFANFPVKRAGDGGKEVVCFVPPQALAGSDVASPSETQVFPLYVNSEQPERCPSRLYRIYADKCPPALVSQGGAFYLDSLPEEVLSPSAWFSSVPVSVKDLQVMLNRIKMVKEIQEAFMNSQVD